MEEAATLRGTLSAMQAQLAAAQSAAEASEAARQRSSADAASLHDELQQVPRLAHEWITWPTPMLSRRMNCLVAMMSTAFRLVWSIAHIDVSRLTLSVTTYTFQSCGDQGHGPLWVLLCGNQAWSRAQIRTERASLAEAFAAASGELARYKEATGRSLESLEAERSSAAALATRSKAQVQP